MAEMLSGETVIPDPSPRELEAELASLLAGVRLVGELDLEGPIVQKASVVVQRAIDEGRAELLASRYPAATVICLVAEGVLNYENGNYWDRLSLHHYDPNALGPQFKSSLEKLGLETFQDYVPQGAYKYVGAILIHGLVARSSAADLLGVVIDDVRNGVSDGLELLASLRARRSKLGGLDRAVQRFLLRGGDVAVDLLQRLVDLVERGDEVAAGTTDARDLGLPRYLVEEFRHLPESIRHLEPRARLPRPQIRLDEWSGPILLLPSVARETGITSWIVGSRKVTASRVDLEFPLTPAAEWTVTAMAQGDRLRSFSFVRIDGAPVYFFSLDGKFIADQRTLSHDRVVVLAPESIEFRSGSETGENLQVVERRATPGGDWSGYRCFVLELDAVTTMWVGAQSALGDPARASVSVRGGRPKLVGVPARGLTTGDGSAVFVTAPGLYVAGERSNSRSTWRAHARRVGDGRRVDLDLEALPRDEDSFNLGDVLEPGIWELSVHGRLGSDLRTQFAYLPGIEVQLPSRVLGPDEIALVPVAVPPPLRIAGHSSNKHSVDVGVLASTDRATFEVETQSGAVEVVLTVPRLRWCLRGPKTKASPLSGEVSRIGIDEVIDRSIGTVNAHRIWQRVIIESGSALVGCQSCSGASLAASSRRLRGDRLRVLASRSR